MWKAVARGEVQFQYNPSADNLADMFTMPLDRVKFTKFRQLIGVS